MNGITRHLQSAAAPGRQARVLAARSEIMEEQITTLKVILSAIGWAVILGFLLAFWLVVDAHLGS